MAWRNSNYPTYTISPAQLHHDVRRIRPEDCEGNATTLCYLTSILPRPDKSRDEGEKGEKKDGEVRQRMSEKFQEERKQKGEIIISSINKPPRKGMIANTLNAQ
jgi:hypothetical protein